MQPKRLYRSKTNRVIAGVCGGLGEYFGIDPIILRIIFFVTSGLGGIYLLMWLLIPNNPNQQFSKGSTSAVKVILILLAVFIVLPFMYFFLKSFLGF